MSINLDDIDTEQLVAFEGYEYRVSNGNSGVQLNIKDCPNCHRSDYKVYLNAETGLGNCFVCNTGFNKYKFVKLARGFTTPSDVMRYLGDTMDTVKYRPKVDPKNYHLNKDWKLPLNLKMQLEEDVHEYLKERSIDARITSRFDLRFCEYGFYEYEDFAGKAKFVDFSQRIIIPVRDIDGKMVTFQGRDITGKSEKKYLFPNMLVGTGRYIYNADGILKNGKTKVVLNEGVFDVWSTIMALESDIKYQAFGAAGTFGKHLSISLTNATGDDQLSDLFKLREQGVDEFIFLWDGERKANVAAMEAATRLNNLGLFSTVAQLSGDKDPNEATTEEVLAAIDTRVEPSPFTLMRLKLNEY